MDLFANYLAFLKIQMVVYFLLPIHCPASILPVKKMQVPTLYISFLGQDPYQDFFHQQYTGRAVKGQ